MANDKTDISDIVKKCKILLLDIEGTTTSISFVKDKLFPYAEENVKEFLNNEWETEDVKEVVAALRKLALEDEEKKVEGVVAIPAEDAAKDDQIEGLVKSVKWQMSSDRKVGPLKQLQGLIWKKGYDKGDIKGHVYDDVSPALELWRSVEGQKVYIYSSGSVQAQKLLFGMSSAGDMLKLIDGHFDTAVGAKQEAASYTNIAEKIGCKADEILFLTDIDKEAEAARSAGVHSALVSREGNSPLPEAVASVFPVLYSFTELAATNKRKPDAQEEEQPAKVPKTDVETDVKTQIESESKEVPKATPPEKTVEETATMEVDEEATAKLESVDGKPSVDSVERVETTVEEITESKQEADMAVCDAKPIIIESAETEMMETEPISSDAAPKANGEKEVSEAKEATPVVITEIKDVTNDKEGISEATEVIEDLVPIVEEPVAQDMEELQNVGEVLEKECDEILSKVQDVTNLDNIPLKPLHTIAEETMETENLDSNDIVEGILDTEQELELKKNTDDKTDKDMPAAKPISDVDKTNAEDVPDKCQVIVPEDALSKTTEENKEAPEEVKEKSSIIEAVSVSEEKIIETKENVEKTSVTEEKLKETSATEVKVNETCTAEEKVKETPEEKAVEASMEVVDTEDNKQTKEIVTESSQTEKEGNKVSEEIVKKNCDTEVKESSIVEESSITKEQIKDSCPVAEKIEEKTSDESKVAEEKVEPQMETDVTTSVNDSSSAVNEKKSEEKSETVKMQVEGEKSDSSKLPTENNAKTVTEESLMEVDQTENKVSEKVDNVSAAETGQPEKDAKETQLNGKATNGDADMVDLNGDANKDDELKSRLSMENGKEVVNGANGDSAVENKSENNGGDVKDVADIKVKTVAVDEPRNDPIEQPTEA